jgi:hypothetical protein
MIVMMIVLVALGTIAGLTVISVQGGSATTSAQRFSAMALYAAESGAAAAMEWLRANYDEATKFSAWVDPNNEPGQSPTDIPGNGARPGAPGNLLSDDQQGWYEVRLLNNRSDPGLGLGNDADGIILIQVTGHGPNGAVKRIEWEVEKPYQDDGTPLPGLALRGWRDLF